MRFLFQILVNALAIFLADYLIAGIIFVGPWYTLLIAGLVLGIINVLVKPILKVLTSPLIFISLGLFSLVINIALLWLVTVFVPELTIIGFWAYFWGALVIAIVNTIFGTGKKIEKASKV